MVKNTAVNISHSLSLSLVVHSGQRACVSIHVVNTFLFSLGIIGDFCFWWGAFYHVKNGGCLLGVFIMRLFNQTRSIDV